MLKKILMNAADGSPGGGAAPAAPAQGAPAQAPAAPPIDYAELAKQIADRVTPTVRDSVFAEARRAGIMPDDKKKKDAAPQGDGAPAPSVGMSHDDVARLVQRTSDLEASLSDAGLDPEQKGLLRSLFKSTNPDDVGGWVGSTLKALKIGRSATQQQNGGAPQAQPPQRPASDGGGPAPVNGQSGDEQLLHKMSKVDRDAWIRQHGHAAYMKKLEEEMRGRAVQVRPGT
jgi:hypothetical protein